MNTQQIKDMIRKSRVIAVLRAPDHDTASNLVKAYVDAGIKFIELTTSTPDWESLITKICLEYEDKAIVGLGTVTNKNDALTAIDNGAQFIVTPYLEPEVIIESKGNDALVMPGALTASEIAYAYKLGADMVKVFPASSVGGPAYIKALLAPMPSWELIPTGGVTPENAADYLKAGVVAVGLGSNLAPRDKVNEKNWDAVTTSVKNFLDYLNRSLEND